MTPEEQLDEAQSLENQAAAIRLTMAKTYLYDDKWRIYSSEYNEGIWYRKVGAKEGDWWKFNIRLDMLHFGKKKGFVRGAFWYLYQLKLSNTLPGMEHELKPVAGVKKLGPEYNTASLPLHLKAAHNRTPPSQEWLAIRYGWDEDLKAFFHVVGDRLVYQMPGSFVKLDDGKLYATWRVKSMLLFGNPEGLVGEAVSVERNRALLSTAPNIVTGIAGDIAAALPDYNKSTIKYKPIVNRAKELEEAAAKRERSIKEKRETKTAELREKRVQELKAARAKADELLAQFEKEVAEPMRRRKAVWRVELSRIRSATK